ncbi:hypothetical protein KC351_g15511 [Hortaea werneckii]|nr:hypothetical protein KC351_g15511 [Hortaea werneckii]
MKRKRDKIDFTGDMMHVKCGGSNKLTHVHRGLLEKWTNIFEVSELVRGTLEPTDKTLDLSYHADHDSFQLVVQWMYSGDAEFVDDAADPVAAISLLERAYGAAERLGIGYKQDDYSLSNSIMDQIVTRMTAPQKFGPVVTVKDFIGICQSDGFRLRGFIQDWLIYGNLTSKVDPVNVAQLVVELYDQNWHVRDFFSAFVNRRLAGNGPAPWEKDPCVYHLHSKESKRCQARASAAPPEDSNRPNSK